jgi:hypothetical protein
MHKEHKRSDWITYYERSITQIRGTEAVWSQQAGTPTSPKVLEQRFSIGIHRILVELPHSSKLEPRNPVDPQRISTELPCLSYKEGSWQAGRPSSPQSLATLPTRLHLATTLRMRALQVEFLCNGVCVSYPVPRKRERSLYTCAQDVQITRIVTIW